MSGSSPLSRTLKSGLHSARASNDDSTAAQPRLLLSERHGYTPFMTHITNSLNAGEAIVRSVRWTHSWASGRVSNWMVNSSLSSATFRRRSSGITVVPNGYTTIRIHIEELDSLSSSPAGHRYDIDVTVWLHAATTTPGSPHQTKSSEWKLSPPWNPARALRSILEASWTKRSLPRSGGDCETVGTG